MKLKQWVKIALLFLHVMLKLFQFTIFKLVQVVLHLFDKNFSKRFTNKSKITMYIHRVVLTELEISLIYSI